MKMGRKPKNDGRIVAPPVPQQKIVKNKYDLTNHQLGYQLEPGDNTTAMLYTKDIVNLPKINLKDVDEVRKRLNEYFDICAKHDLRPSAMSMARSLKMTRQTLSAIVYDKTVGSSGYTSLPPDVVSLLKDYYGSLEMQWDISMQYGKINPVTGIFLGKNYYGMVDQVDYSIKPQLEKETIDVQSIKERYANVIETDENKK